MATIVVKSPTYFLIKHLRCSYALVLFVAVSLQPQTEVHVLQSYIFALYVKSAVKDQVIRGYRTRDTTVHSNNSWQRGIVRSIDTGS